MVINGYADLARKLALPDSASGQSLQQIRKARDRAASLTHQLLAFSRKQILEPRNVDLNVLVAETTEMLRRLIGEDVELETRLEACPRMVKIDSGQFVQVLLNLAVNARDAMPRGGRLVIETCYVGAGGSAGPEAPGLTGGHAMVLSVSDAGCGMDEATKARIFEPFFTTKGLGKGSGLGLATVYGIVAQSGGRITEESAPDRGTTFRISLPCMEAGAVTEDSEAGSGLSARGSETIMLVEDDPDVRGFAREVLRTHGYLVVEGANGEDALRTASSYPGPLHLLVTDVVMPGMSGRELADEIAAARPGIKTLYVSAYTDDNIIRHGIQQEEVAFLQKPFTPERLLQKVREALAESFEAARPPRRLGVP